MTLAAAWPVDTADCPAITDPERYFSGRKSSATTS